MIDFDSAVARVLQSATKLPAQKVALSDAAGRISATDIDSAINLPPFDNSAMDGFALTRSAAAGAILTVTHSQAAGDADVRPQGEAIEIMTGAKVPPGFITVVPVENTRTLAQGPDGKPSQIELNKDAQSKANIRRAGEDIQSGERIVKD